MGRPTYSAAGFYVEPMSVLKGINHTKLVRMRFVLKALQSNKGFSDILDQNKLAFFRSHLPNPTKGRFSKSACFLTGRTRGRVGLVGLSRFKVKKFAETGVLPGIVKSS